MNDNKWPPLKQGLYGKVNFFLSTFKQAHHINKMYLVDECYQIIHSVKLHCVKHNLCPAIKVYIGNLVFHFPTSHSLDI